MISTHHTIPVYNSSHGFIKNTTTFIEWKAQIHVSPLLRLRNLMYEIMVEWFGIATEEKVRVEEY